MYVSRNRAEHEVKDREVKKKTVLTGHCDDVGMYGTRPDVLGVQRTSMSSGESKECGGVYVSKPCVLGAQMHCKFLIYHFWKKIYKLCGCS